MPFGMGWCASNFKKNKNIEQKTGNNFKKKPPTFAGGFLYKYKFN
jgi:hypothetical protein